MLNGIINGIINTNGEVSMKMKKIKTPKSSGWLAKVSRILTVTMLISAFIHQGWYGPKSSDAAPTANGRIVHSVNTATPTDKIYTASSNTFAAGSAMTAGAAAPTFIVNRSATTRNESMAGFVTTAGVLHIYKRSGAAWIEVTDTAAPGGWGVGTRPTVGGNGVDGRRFDIAYEKTSGRAMVVYSRNANGSVGNEMAYRIWDGATWTAATNINSARFAQAAAVTSIKMKSNPLSGSNEIALTAADSGTTTANTSVLTSFIWNGSAWTEPAAAHTTATTLYLPNTTAQLMQNDLFDLAYESLTGDLMVVFTITNTTGPVGQQFYITKTAAGSWGTATSYATARLAPLQMIAESNPNTDQILVMWNRTASATVYANIWSGTAVGTTTTISNANGVTTAIQKKHITGKWLRVGATDYAVPMWNTLTAGTIGYAYYTGTTWTAGASGFTYATGVASALQWMDTDVDPQGSDTLMLTYSDAATDLHARRLVLSAGPTFTFTTPTGSPLTATLTNQTTQNFDFAYDIFSATAPTLTSPTATSIADTTATLGANITSDGGAAITVRGTVWGTTAAPTGTELAEGGTATGVFTQARTGLTAGTKLYYRGYATNPVGTAYSSDGSFYTEPATQASGVNFTSVDTTSMTVNWTRGDGDGVIVLMKLGSAVDSNPVDGAYTGYTANAAFTSGTQIGTGNYVMYKGTGTSVAVTGLSDTTAYYVAVYEYKGTVDTAGVDQGANYKATPVTGNQTTALPCVAGQPTGLGAGSATTTSITLTWTGGVNTDYFNVYRNAVKISTDGAVTTGSFTDTGRSPSVTYSYYVKGHNTANNCDSAASSTLNKSTLAATPVAPTVVNVNVTSVNVTINSDGNSTEATYAIRANNSESLYVQADGTLNTAVVWQTKAAWGTKTVTGLSAIPYTFDVKARNGNGELVETAFGPDSSPAVTPHVMLPITIVDAGGCGACHGNPPVDNATRDASTGTFPGSHNKHAGTYGFACTKCHVDNTTYNHRNSDINMNPAGINGEGTYTKGTSWAQTNSPAPFGTCTNFYCHSKGTIVATGGAPTVDNPPTWGGTVNCNSCHTAPPDYANNTPKKNSHMYHPTECQKCHRGTTSDGATITGVARHNNKFYNLSASANQFDTYSFATTGGTCKNVDCHAAQNGTWGVTTFACLDCHKKVITKTLGSGGTLRNVTTDFKRLSRHVSNSTGAAGNAGTLIVTKWDCIVCHMEGQEAAGTTQGHTNPTNHNDAGGLVNLRNVDTPTTGWAINNKSYNEQMRTYQDTFCMTCHDSDGAAGINVNATNNGLNLNNTRALTPFNTSDTIRNGRDTFTTRTRVVDVKSQFYAGTGGSGAGYNGNPSQHAVLGARYSTNNASWTAATWTANVLKNTSTINLTRERARLHCSDCHLSEVNAHGARNAWHLLLNGTVNDITGDTAMSGVAPTTVASIVCYKCHASGVYSATGTAGSRYNHGNQNEPIDASYGDAATDGAKLGPMCLLCHGGAATATGNAGFGLIHGRGTGGGTGEASNTYTPAGGAGVYSKYRFMPGAEFEWKPGTAADDTVWAVATTGTCYMGPASTTWSTCTSHDAGSGGTFTPLYGRAVKY